MRRTVTFLTLLLVAAPAALAGCLNPQSGNVDSAARAAPSLLPDLSDVPEPPMDAERGRLWWEDFVGATPYRHVGSPTNAEASSRLARDLADAGYEVKTFYYAPGGMASPAEQGIRTVVGLKPGQEMPEHVIAWVAHYDTNAATIYGAYDDGSGVAVAMELARTLAAYNNSKTLMPIFFDAEEIGLVASDYFVKQATANKDAVYDLVIGHDMTGINCPGHEWKMYQFVAANVLTDVKPVLQDLYGAKLTAEENACIEFHDEVIRNSDERRFQEIAPVIRMAGGFKAADYPEYHKPGDTVQHVYDFAGGEKNYELGFALTVKTSYWATIAFDRLPSMSPAK